MRCSRSSSCLVAAAALPYALLLFCCLTTGDAANGGLRLGYYSSTCPPAEDIVREQVAQLYHKHGNTAVSWLRALFHDCMVGSCDASLLLDTSPAAGVSEKSAPRSFGMRNFKYIDVIKAALERECPGTVSCADVLARMAADNGYFHDRFAAALLTLSENNPLGADEGEVRRDCRFVNPA